MQNRLTAENAGPHRETEFMRFWWAINRVLQDRGLPELRYGEARDWWNDSKLAV